MKGLNGIILIGRPGSGKSEIAKMVANAYDGMSYVSSGDIARNMATTDQRTSRLLANGKMAPESAMRTAIRCALYDINYHRGTFVLDGFPRTTDQLEWLRENHPVLLFYHIDVPEDICVERMGYRGRTDDTLNTIKSRLSFYDNFTKPILNAIPHVTISNIGGVLNAVGEVIADIDERMDLFAGSQDRQI